MAEEEVKTKLSPLLGMASEEFGEDGQKETMTDKGAADQIDEIYRSISWARDNGSYSRKRTNYIWRWRRQ